MRKFSSKYFVTKIDHFEVEVPHFESKIGPEAVFVQRIYSTVEDRRVADFKIFMIFEPQTTEYDPGTPPPVPQ